MWLNSCIEQSGPLDQFRHVKYEDVGANITSPEEVNEGHYEVKTMRIGKLTTARQPREVVNSDESEQRKYGRRNNAVLQRHASIDGTRAAVVKFGRRAGGTWTKADYLHVGWFLLGDLPTFVQRYAVSPLFSFPLKETPTSPLRLS